MSLSTLSPLTGVVYGLQFIHEGVEYVCTHWLDDSGNPYQLSLSRVVERNGKFISGQNVAAVGTSEAFVTHQGGFEDTCELFLTRVNAYLLSQMEDDVIDDTFPDTPLEQFNWFIQKGMVYANNKLQRVA